MKRPNKEDYDFNDIFESAKFGVDMIKYSDFLEGKILTEEEYLYIKNIKPENRCNKSGDVIQDKIFGILLLFNKKCQMRNNWIDIITMTDAEKEIKELITESNGDVN